MRTLAVTTFASLDGEGRARSGFAVAGKDAGDDRCGDRGGPDGEDHVGGGPRQGPGQRVSHGGRWRRGVGLDELGVGGHCGPPMA